MRVKNVMTTPIVGIEPDASIADAARLMLGHKISGLPVIAAGGELLGMVSEGDFLRRAELGTEPRLSALRHFLESSGKQADSYVHTHGRKVREVMTAPVYSIGADATLEDAVEAMLQHHVKRLPVVENGKVIGIVSRSDLMRALVDALPSATVDADDARIGQAIAAELGAQIWGGAIKVAVKAGVVTLSGAIFDERARPAALVVAENVPGVKSVIDKLMWIEPMSGMIVLPDQNAA